MKSSSRRLQPPLQPPNGGARQIGRAPLPPPGLSSSAESTSDPTIQHELDVPDIQGHELAPPRHYVIRHAQHTRMSYDEFGLLAGEEGPARKFSSFAAVRTR